MRTFLLVVACVLAAFLAAFFFGTRAGVQNPWTPDESHPIRCTVPGDCSEVIEP